MGKLLVACEESQAVCLAFRRLGYEAYSCDLQEQSGGFPQFHITGDAMEEAYSGNYTMMIAHPPCTYLSRAGARWMYPTAGKVCEERLRMANEAKDFFIKLLEAPIKHKAIENPTPLKLVGLPEYTQVIQPYQFGHPFSKRTLLWLTNLPKLTPTEVLHEYSPYLPSNTGSKKRGQKTNRGVAKNSKEASKTFAGVANAMADQWGRFLE